MGTPASAIRGFSHQRHALAGAIYYRLTAFAQERMASQDKARNIKIKVPEVGRARSFAKRDKAIDLGRKLIAIKAELPHGHFLPWVRDKSGISYGQAQRFMRAAKEAETCGHDGHAVENAASLEDAQ